MGGNDRGPTEIKIPANGYWNYFVSLEAIGWSYCRSFMGEQGLPLMPTDCRRHVPWAEAIDSLSLTVSAKPF